MIGKLLLQVQVRPIVASHNHQSTGSFVEAMDDSGPLLASQNRQLPQSMKQSMNERAGVVAFRRMDHHSRGFVDHRNVLVLIANVEVQVFGQKPSLRDLGQLQPHCLP